MQGMIILDAAIGLILVYLVLSLMRTAIQEIIARWMGLGAKNLNALISDIESNIEEVQARLETWFDPLGKFPNIRGAKGKPPRSQPAIANGTPG